MLFSELLVLLFNFQGDLCVSILLPCSTEIAVLLFLLLQLVLGFLVDIHEVARSPFGLASSLRVKVNLFPLDLTDIAGVELPPLVFILVVPDVGEVVIAGLVSVVNDDGVEVVRCLVPLFLTVSNGVSLHFKMVDLSLNGGYLLISLVSELVHK